MTKKINKKDIVCYNCEQTKGIAKLKARKINDIKTVLNKKTGKPMRIKTGKKKTIYVWEAKGFQLLGTDAFLCNECSKNKCRKCYILLGDKKCSTCGEYHGAFYKEHPKYCKKCWDEIEASKKL
jgi:hypothetical protein